MSVRKPKEIYRHRNGFAEHNGSPNDPDRIQEADAVALQDIARFVQRDLGSYFPSRAKMKEIAETSETLANLRERIVNLNKEHKENMTKLYAAHAKDIKADALDRYLQMDASLNEKASRNEWPEVEELYRFHSRIQATEATNVMERFRYGHLQMMLPLYQRRVEMEQSEEEARIINAARFPLNIQDYRAMDVKTAQLRVARFLMADEVKKDQMRTESRWAWRQTRPLIEEYGRNSDFKAEIQKIVQEVETRDPRGRRL